MFKPAFSEMDLAGHVAVETTARPTHFKRLYVVLDGTFTLKDGKPASYNMDYEFFKRYSAVFEEVVVVARLFKREDEAARPAEGPKVRFLPLPQFKGPKQFLFAMPKVMKLLLSIARDRDGTVLVRTPSTAGNMLGHFMMAVGRPYGIELVGDPRHAYSKESLQHPLSGLFQWMFTSSCQFLCRRAETASYVTRETLQHDYPPGPKTKAFHYTSLDLPQAGLADASRAKESFAALQGEALRPVTLVQVAMMQNYYKGHDISLGMMARFKEMGLDIRLKLVGDGSIRQELEAECARLDISDRVDFVGLLEAGSDVWAQLDGSDMLILPSRQEGLPRVVIEAMARGLPCVSNRIGGAGELLDDAQLIDDLSVEVFSDRVLKNLSDTHALAQQSARNLAVAERYLQPAVQRRREACYHILKHQLTAEAQYI